MIKNLILWIMGKRTENESLRRTGRSLFIYSVMMVALFVCAVVIGYCGITEWSFNYNKILPHLFDVWGFTA